MTIDVRPTPEQRALQQLAREFAEKEIAPRAAAIDAEPDPAVAFPWDIYEKGNRLGFNKITIPAEYGGLGLGDMESVLVIEELSVADGGVGTTYFVHNSLVYWILGACSPEQQKKYLSECVSDPEERYFISVGDTEHGKSGDGTPRSFRRSAPMTLGDFATAEVIPPAKRRERTTVARREGDNWVLNGMKRFITTAGRNKLYLITATADSSRPDFEATELFLVPANTPGVSIGHIEDKMGQRAAQNAEVVLENVVIPESQRAAGGLRSIGVRGNNLNTLCAAVFVGIARRAFEEANAYAKERYKGGTKIVHHQAVQRMLVDMVIGIKTARLLTWMAAHEGDVRQPCAGAGLAKVYASEMAVKATNDAMQVFGGYGYMRDFVLEKLVRDARLGPIYDASNEMIRHGQILPTFAVLGTA
ncbi:MAG: acyl-CoA dehydrogenase family protein [Dehalococcoidia bacterium]|nr:acyl-CoA dehydrogenase family protein [Dehalococcoidia bacterium]